MVLARRLYRARAGGYVRIHVQVRAISNVAWSMFPFERVHFRVLHFLSPSLSRPCWPQGSSCNRSSGHYLLSSSPSLIAVSAQVHYVPQYLDRHLRLFYKASLPAFRVAHTVKSFSSLTRRVRIRTNLNRFSLYVHSDASTILSALNFYPNFIRALTHSSAFFSENI